MGCGDDDRGVRQAELAARRQAVMAGDELIAVSERPHDQRDEQPAQRNRLRERSTCASSSARTLSRWWIALRASRSSRVAGVLVDIVPSFGPWVNEAAGRASARLGDAAAPELVGCRRRSGPSRRERRSQSVDRRRLRASSGSSAPTPSDRGCARARARMAAKVPSGVPAALHRIPSGGCHTCERLRRAPGRNAATNITRRASSRQAARPGVSPDRTAGRVDPRAAT